jgi:hypothetical protein
MTWSFSGGRGLRNCSSPLSLQRLCRPFYSYPIGRSVSNGGLRIVDVLGFNSKRSSKMCCGVVEYLKFRASMLPPCSLYHLHGVTTRKTTTWIFIFVKTSNVAFFFKKIYVLYQFHIKQTLYMERKNKNSKGLTNFKVGYQFQISSISVNRFLR